MYTSPIEVKLSEHFSVLKTVEFDKEQYEQGWHDRDSQIVRCEDCKYCDRGNYTFWDDGYGAIVSMDGYCSFAKRREDVER